MSRRRRFLHHTFPTLSPWVSMKTGQLLPEHLRPHLWVFSVPASPQCILTVPDFPSLSVLFSLVAQSCPTLCDPMDCSMPGLPVHHQLSELAQTHVHQVGDAIQPSHLLSSTSPPAFNLSQRQDLFQGVSSWHQVAKVLEFQLQHQSFQ